VLSVVLYSWRARSWRALQAAGTLRSNAATQQQQQEAQVQQQTTTEPNAAHDACVFRVVLAAA
jgi:hypothetical protein